MSKSIILDVVLADPKAEIEIELSSLGKLRQETSELERQQEKTIPGGYWKIQTTNRYRVVLQ